MSAAVLVFVCVRRERRAAPVTSAQQKSVLAQTDRPSSSTLPRSQCSHIGLVYVISLATSIANNVTDVVTVPSFGAARAGRRLVATGVTEALHVRLLRVLQVAFVAHAHPLLLHAQLAHALLDFERIARGAATLALLTMEDLVGARHHPDVRADPLAAALTLEVAHHLAQRRRACPCTAWSVRARAVACVEDAALHLHG